MNTLPTVTANGRDMAGSAMVACLVTTFLLLSTGITSLMVMVSKQAVARRAIEVDLAYMEAEAAADLALCEMRARRDYAADGVGIVAANAGPGNSAAWLEPPYAGPGSYTLVARATVGRVTRTIEVTIQKEPGPPGFAGYSALSFSGTGVVDSYDSSLGTYGSQPPGNDVRVRSNGNIVVAGGAQVHGDATPGPTGTVSGAAAVTGSTAPATDLMPVPPYVYAPPIAASGPYTGTNTYGAGIYRHTTLTLNSSRVLTIAGDVELYVDGNFSISAMAMIVLNSGCRLTIHHGSGTMNIAGQGVINLDQAPERLTIKSATSSAVSFAGGSAFYGTLMAPYAPLTCSGSAGVYGAAAGRTLTMSGGMHMHYDKVLDESGPVSVRLIRPLGRTAGKS